MTKMHHLFYQSEKDGKWKFFMKHKSSDYLEECFKVDTEDQEITSVNHMITFFEEDQLETFKDNLNKEFYSKPRFTLKQSSVHKGYFPDLNSACAKAADLYAQKCGLPSGKYHLTWEIVLKDCNGMTRVWKSAQTNFVVIVESYG